MGWGDGSGFILQMSEIQVTDVEEAKIMISMKNDEIKSLNNKMKMVEKKSNIKLAESTYQIQQLTNKLQDSKKNIDRLKETHAAELERCAEAEDKLKQEISKLKDTINDMLKNERQLERAHKASFYEYDLKLNEEREQKQALSKELKEITKLFNPKEIIKQLGLQSIDDITPYMKLKEQLKFKSEEASLLAHQLEQYKAETFHAIEESFSKLSSYEEVMENLRAKNSELEEIMMEKERAIEEKHSELEEKDHMLAQVEAFTTEKYNEMSSEMEQLRRSVQNYERESINYNHSREEHENNLKFIFELSSEFERKEEDYLSKIMELEMAFQTMETQKEDLVKDYNEHLARFKDEQFALQKALERAEQNLKDKEEIITLLTNSVRDLEGEYELAKAELEKTKLEASELIRRKHKLQEELIEKEVFYQSKEESLLEELELLRHCENNRRSHGSEEAAQEFKATPISLEEELEPEPNWFELYGACLQKYNKFIREVYFLYRKQDRKQSASLEHTGF